LATPPCKLPQQHACPWLHNATLLSILEGPLYYVPLPGKAPNLIAFASASSPTLAASAPPETPNPQHITPALHPQSVNSPKVTRCVYAGSQYGQLQLSVRSPVHRARLHSIACRMAGAFLGTLSTCPRLTLSDSEFVDSCQFCCLCPMPPAATCYCVAQL
jgi:hypothetical protein